MAGAVYDEVEPSFVGTQTFHTCLPPLSPPLCRGRVCENNDLAMMYSSEACVPRALRISSAKPDPTPHLSSLPVLMLLSYHNAPTVCKVALSDSEALIPTLLNQRNIYARGNCSISLVQ